MTPEELDYFARQCRHKNLNPQPVLDLIASLQAPAEKAAEINDPPKTAGEIHFAPAVAPAGPSDLSTEDSAK